MRTLLAVVLCLLAAVDARAWPVAVGTRAPTSLTVDRRGNVLAAIPVELPGNVTYDVAKLDHVSGHLRWRHRINGTGRERNTEVAALVPTPDGDTIVVGTVLDADGEDMLVARLAGNSGRERWRSRLRGRQSGSSYNTGRAATLDAKGDVVVAGTLANVPEMGGDYGDFTVAKLDGGTGEERWRFTLDAPPGEDDAQLVAVDGAGDVVAAGQVYGSTPLMETVSVVKVAGDTGQLLWRRDLDVAWRTSALVLDSAGNALLAVSTIEARGNDFGVVKLAAGSGDILWMARESGSDRRYQEALRVVVDPSGAVFASGITDDGVGPADSADGEVFTVVRLDSATGAHVWGYQTTGTAGGGSAHELQLGPPGRLIAGGSTVGVATCADVVLVELDTRTGRPVWSRTFDGTLVARHGCTRDSESPGPGPPMDNDELGAMVTDARGRVFAGVMLVNRDRNGARNSASIRRLAVPR